jgi:hypothetical protein
VSLPVAFRRIGVRQNRRKSQSASPPAQVDQNNFPKRHRGGGLKNKSGQCGFSLGQLIISLLQLFMVTGLIEGHFLQIMPTPSVKTEPPFWQLSVTALMVVAVAVLLPFTPAGVYLGFVAPPAFFFLILAVMLLAYLLAVEGIKQWFFRHFAAE